MVGKGLRSQSDGLFDLDNFLQQKSRFLVAPSVYFTPETNWYFGLGGFYFFKYGNDIKDTITRPSTFQMALGYTLNKQVVFWMPGEIFFKNNNYRLQTELGFYRWPYFFNGIGNGYEDFYEERYTATFPRARVSFQKRFGKALYTGPRYWFQQLNMLEVESGGLLDQGIIPGGNGGVNSGLGWVVLYDTRNSVFASSEGWYVEYSNLFNQKAFGSDFNYSTHLFDVRKYLNIANEHIVAFQTYTKLNFGNAPFNQMALMGGPQRMRGYREGWYRDNHMSIFQLEYRSPIFYHVGLVAFGGVGVIAPKLNAFALSNARTSVGLGTRVSLDKKERLHIRLDYGWGQGQENRFAYITIGEAF